jgi:hypothetical protein
MTMTTRRLRNAAGTLRKIFSKFAKELPSED